MPVPTRSVYVGNIPFTSSVESLMEAFAEYEPIGVKVVEGRGVAFIEVPARRAYAMVRDTDGSKLEGRLLSVSVARARENEPTMTQDQGPSRMGRPQGDRNNYQSNDFRPSGGSDNPRFGNRNREDGNTGGPPRRDDSGGDRRFDQNRGFDRGNRGPNDSRPNFNSPRPNDRPHYGNSDRNGGNRPAGRWEGRNDAPNSNTGGERRPWSRDGGPANGGDRGPRPNSDRPFDRNRGPSSDNRFNAEGRPGGGNNRPDAPQANREFKRPGPPYSGRPDSGPGKPRKFFKKR